MGLIVEDNLLHERQISVRAFGLDDTKMLIVGCLQDCRPIATETHFGVQPEGIIHDVRLELEVNIPDMVIANARLQMPQVPWAECRAVAPLVEELVGLRMHSGFAKGVNQRMGGARGCAHLVNLILAMAPAALQSAGMQLHRQAKANQGRTMAGTLAVNSCHVWREDGPLVALVRERVRKEAQGEQGDLDKVAR